MITAQPVTTARPETALAIAGVDAGYLGVPVVRGLNLDVAAGEIVALLGPNGAGKTTTLRTISGLLPLLNGTIEVLGKPIDSRSPHRLARRGVSHVADDRSLFPGLTVRENLRMAPGLRRRHRAAAYDCAVDIFAALAPLTDRQAGLLSGGEQQMLALARAIVCKPRLWLKQAVNESASEARVVGLPAPMRGPELVDRVLPLLLAT